MTKTIAEVRFDKARKRLSGALKELEEVVKNKIHETAAVQVSVTDEAGQRVVNNSPSYDWAAEVNSLQNSLAELGREAEFLREKNNVLNRDIAEVKSRKYRMIEEVEKDLVKIEKIISESL